MIEEKKLNGNHRIVIDDRERMELDGIIDVLAFDEEEVVLETEQGMLIIKGTDLHVNHLNLENGKVRLDGMLESLSYSENDVYGKSGGSFFSKLLKG